MAVWQPASTTADVTVTKIAGYIRVRIIMNRGFFRIFGIHSFYVTATLLNISLSRATDMVTQTFQAYRLAAAARRPLLMTTGMSTSTGMDFEP